MKLLYICLSPTFGMHQYTADLANRMAAHGHDVHVLTTAHFPADRYSPDVHIYTPIANRTTGFSTEGLDRSAYREILATIRRIHPQVIHFSSPHLWNPFLISALHVDGVPVVHSLHDIDPHAGGGPGLLIRFWNHLIITRADHIVVHGQRYRQQLLARGLSPLRITQTPLLHLFLSNTHLTASRDLATDITYEPWGLFFGRIERYKGIEHLLTAAAMLDATTHSQPAIVIAGPGRIADFWAGSLPPQVELRNHLIQDEEAIDLFRRCRCLILPYIDATQSALIAAAYYFHKTVIVSRSGALPEYVQDNRTGIVVEPGHPASLNRWLDHLLVSPDRAQQLGEAGRAWYEDQRQQEEQSLIHMYQNLLRRQVVGHGEA